MDICSVMQPKTERILMGLDVSSTTIGICVLSLKDDTVTLKHLDHFKPPKTGHLIERLAKTRAYIQKQLAKYNPDEIVIEDILLGMGGKTTIKTLSSLAVFNRVVCLAAYDQLGRLPYLYTVLKVRHAIKLDKTLPKKEDMPELVAKILKIKFPYLLKNGKIIVENYDRADAVAVVLAHLKLVNK
jgi:Holliday junction resolvasome RuvABC endonuclease subunit